MSGPLAKPSRNVVTPNVETVLEQLKCKATLVMAAVCMLEQKAIVAVIITTMIVHVHLLLAGQLNGSSSAVNVSSAVAVPSNGGSSESREAASPAVPGSSS